MRSRRSTVAAVILLPVALAAGGEALAQPFESGAALARAVHERPDGEDAVQLGTMILRQEGSAPRVRKLYTYRKDDSGDGGSASLIRFTAPADIDGVGLLTRDHADAESEQWLYLPALGRVRRIPADRQGGRFVGSDLYFEDLRDREPSEDRHQLRGEAEFESFNTVKLESVPRDPESSAYARRVSWVHPRTLIPLRVDYFGPDRDQPIKRLTVQRIERIQGFWAVMQSTMEDLTSDHRTVLETERITYNQGLPDSLFSRQTLEDPSRERRYRP